MNPTGPLQRVGVVFTQPLFWAVLTAILARSGASGRKAALRGSAGYLLSGAIANGMKPLFGRPQPRHETVQKPEVMRGSFPSGHGAAELAYTYGAALEKPSLRIPLGAVAVLAHLSQVRSQKHYTSDMLAGKVVGFAVVKVTATLWPPSLAD